MPYVAPAAVTSGAVISKTTFGDVVIADLNFLANPPACRVTHNVAQSITDATETSLVFNTERFDTDNMHSTVTNTGRITFNTAGVYVVTFNGLMANGATYDSIYSTIRRDGGTNIASRGVTLSPAGAALIDIGLWTINKFTAGQYVEVRVFQDNAANTARNVLSTAEHTPEFAAVWVGLG